MKNYKFVTAGLPVLLLLIAFVSAAEFNKTSPVKAEVSETEPIKQSAQSAIPARAPSGEQIDWWVVSSGGTDGNSTNFGLQSTVSQTAVGYGTSTNFGLSSGFWFGSGGNNPTCCIGAIRGNVDYDGGDAIDISDLVYLVDYMFSGGPPPVCLEEADLDVSGGIDISDLVYLVDYMFTGGPPPLACP